MKLELSQPLRGIVPPVVTPLTNQAEIDLESLERLLEHLIHGGVHGLFLLGTTGEGPSLEMKLRRQLIRHASEIADGRVPILVAITDSALQESVGLANYAADQGCDAVVAAPPYYFPLNQSDLQTYFKQLNHLLPLPLVLYNMPALAGTAFELETVRQLLGEDSIVGLKDSSGDLAFFKQLLLATEARRDFSLMVGPEHLLAEALALGGSGGVPGGANISPRLFVDLYNAALENDRELVAQRKHQVNLLGKIYKIPPQSIPAIVARIKSALSICEICNDLTALPINKIGENDRLQIKEILMQLGIVPCATSGNIASTHSTLG